MNFVNLLLLEYSRRYFPVQQAGWSTRNKRKMTDAVFTVLLGSSIFSPLTILGPVIPQGTIISSTLTLHVHIQYLRGLLET